MRVWIKDFAVDMELKTRGIELTIYDNQGGHRGDLRIGKATIEWCRGRVRQGHGRQKSWDDMIGFFEQ